MRFTLYVERDRTLRTSEHASLEKAVEDAAAGEDAGEFLAIRIAGPGGFLLEDDALRIAILRTLYDWDSRRERRLP